MKTAREESYTIITPPAEDGLTEEEKLIRRQLLEAPAPLTYAAVLIAELQAKLAEKEPKP